MSDTSSKSSDVQKSSKKIACIIGAGTAGLCAIKRCIENGVEAVCYEQSSEIGGTWVYNEDVENVEFEEDIQSSMYEGLRTNLPKEIMGYPDFSFPTDEESSFITADKVLAFLQSYADHFQLRKYITFKTEVYRVRPKSYAMHDERFWEVYIKNVATGEFDRKFFDFVFVCNGHYTLPDYPEIEGMELYQGKKLHSHLYRKASNYKDETILIIGAGPSGMDLAYQLNNHAKHVYLSHHLNPAPSTATLKKVTQKPDLERFTENGAVFKDGTIEKFSMVLFCTGYQYSFPFLSVDCEINLTEDFVQPLYKHIINIPYPTMALIGLPFKVCPTQLFDLQIRFALKFFLNEKKLPSMEEMMEELQQEIESRKKQGLPPKRFHEMGERQFDYYKDLADTAGIEPIKPVICNIMKSCKTKYITELDSYRDYCFKIIDDENFVKHKCAA